MSPIPVPPDVESDKNEFMVELLVDAVGRCLQQGDSETARQLLNEKYYPHWGRLMALRRNVGARVRTGRASQSLLRVILAGWVQSACARMPAPVGCPLYRSIRRAKSAVSAFK